MYTETAIHVAIPAAQPSAAIFQGFILFHQYFLIVTHTKRALQNLRPAFFFP